MRPLHNVTAVAAAAATPVSRQSCCEDLEKLRLECPKATPCERQRFLNAKDGNFQKALEQLTLYLDWRNRHGLDDVYHCSKSIQTKCGCCEDEHEQEDNNNDTSFSSTSDSDDEATSETEIWHSCASDHERLDELDWRFASQEARCLHEQQGLAVGNNNNKQPKKKVATTTATKLLLPQLARILPPSNDSTLFPRDQSGHKILQFLPAMVDLSKASEKDYALSIALYLERKLDRDSPEKITVAIDVRGGIGWANPKPQKLLPFIKEVARVLEQNFPERLAKCVVFPVPAAATLLYRMVKVFLDPSTVQKVGLVRGDSRETAPAPYASMEAYIEPSVLKQMEEFRMASVVVAAEVVATTSTKKKKKKKEKPLIVATIGTEKEKEGNATDCCNNPLSDCVATVDERTNHQSIEKEILNPKSSQECRLPCEKHTESRVGKQRFEAKERAINVHTFQSLVPIGEHSI